jgi:hypothetical protein
LSLYIYEEGKYKNLWNKELNSALCRWYVSVHVFGFSADAGADWTRNWHEVESTPAIFTISKKKFEKDFPTDKKGTSRHVLH